MLFGIKKKVKETKEEVKKEIKEEVKEIKKEEEKEVVKKLTKEIKRDDKNPGSSEAQISNLTARINTLAEHLKKNKKDKHSTRGLLQMVADRRRIVKYLKRRNPESYDKLADQLGLKK